MSVARGWFQDECIGEAGSAARTHAQSATGRHGRDTLIVECVQMRNPSNDFVAVVIAA
jgi:hypothetical protein